MRSILTVLLLLFATALFAADDPRIAEGIRLHDLGKYDEAAAQYRAVLADDPQNTLAAYELALTLNAQGNYAECRTVIEPVAKKKSSIQALALTTLGNCLDHLGDPKGAIAAYKRGLKLTPDDAGILYNYAVTLVGQGDLDEARKLLKKELALRPSHASGHYALAQVFQKQGFRGPAVLSYLRMFAYELATPRSKDAAQNVLALLGAGVSSSADGMNINIVVDPKPRKGEGDYSGWEMMMALATAARGLPEEASKTEFEKARTQIDNSLTMLLESAEGGRDYTATRNVPFFADLHREGLLDVYSAAVLVTLDLPGETEWMTANKDKVEKLAAFLARQRGGSH